MKCKNCNTSLGPRAYECPKCKTPTKPPALPVNTMISCPTCEKQISSSASSCPNCGHPINTPPPPIAAAPAAKKTSGGVWLAGVAGVIIVVFMLMSGASIDTSPAPAPKPADYTIPVSWEFVRAGLKSPSTADFGRISTHQLYTIEGKPNTWEVRGHVDSQNSFGAMIRSNYTCQLEYVSGGGSNVADWKLLDLKIE